jgi:hypothetical protein
MVSAKGGFEWLWSASSTLHSSMQGIAFRHGVGQGLSCKVCMLHQNTLDRLLRYKGSPSLSQVRFTGSSQVFCAGTPVTKWYLACDLCSIPKKALAQGESGCDT